MEDIIQKAMYYCALVYVNGQKNLEYVWDDSLTMEQKAKEVSEMLSAMGYELKKREI